MVNATVKEKMMSIKSLVSMLFFICFVFAALCFNGCANQQSDLVAKTAAEMLAEEIGIAVAQNNPDLIKDVLPYYDTMKEIYEQGDSENLSIMVNYGIEFILNKYVGDDLTSKRIRSKVERLMLMSGFDTGELVTPEAQEIAKLAMDYTMGVVDAFVGGMQMV